MWPMRLVYTSSAFPRPHRYSQPCSQPLLLGARDDACPSSDAVPSLQAGLCISLCMFVRLLAAKRHQSGD